jgi:hypothetical protein
MRDVAEILVPWAVVTLALFALLDWDESRLTRTQLERAWPPATRTLSVVYFGGLGVPVLVHFWRTRRSVAGVLVGIVGGALAFGLNLAAAVGVDALPEDAAAPLVAFVGIAFLARVFWLSSRARHRKDRVEHPDRASSRSRKAS